MWRGTQTLLKAKILKRPENFSKNKAFHISSIRLLSSLFFFVFCYLVKPIQDENVR